MEPEDRNKTHEAELARCREEVERAQAHLIAAEAPDAWITATDDDAALEAALASNNYPIETEAARQLLIPLDIDTRRQLIDRVVNSYLENRSVAAQEPKSVQAPLPLPLLKRKWLTLPLTAVAASLLTLFYINMGNSGAGSGSIQGIVSASAGTRTGSTQKAGGALRLRGGEWFTLDCKSQNQAIRVVSVRAFPTTQAKDKTARWLGAETLETTDQGARLHVHAELPPGPWRVSCEVQSPTSGDVTSMSPAALIILE
ncbi:MAG TPA: hypothetical protein ENK31_00435 [Nannocystis exedens]|nr:hypothetical protein [Nannocystis exedens]